MQTLEALIRLSSGPKLDHFLYKKFCASSKQRERLNWSLKYVSVGKMFINQCPVQALTHSKSRAFFYIFFFLQWVFNVHAVFAGDITMPNLN